MPALAGISAPASGAGQGFFSNTFDLARSHPILYTQAPLFGNSMNSVEHVEHGSDAAEDVKWSYDVAFARNLGLVSPDEQRRLRDARVAIAGMGGVGGVHLITLARLGVGRFSVADPDIFTTANFNRQYGATLRNLGRGKAESMAEEAGQINPELDIRVLSGPITSRNVGEFLEGVSVVLDGIDFFAFDTRRLLFREARQRGLWAITAGPLGFGAAWILFDPRGMDFDTYFDLHDGMAAVDQFAAFATAPRPPDCTGPISIFRTYKESLPVGRRRALPARSVAE